MGTEVRVLLSLVQSSQQSPSLQNEAHVEDGGWPGVSTYSFYEMVWGLSLGDSAAFLRMLSSVFKNCLSLLLSSYFLFDFLSSSLRLRSLSCQLFKK